MDHGPLRLVADTCQWVFSEALRNAGGTDGTFCRRPRVITPCRLGLARTAPCASQRVEPRAAVPCGCQALCGPPVPSKACSHQGATPHWADGARTMAARRIRAMRLNVLGGAPGPAGAAWRPLVRPAGSAVALHDGGREGLPGRFQVVKPAAGALQTTMDLRCAAPWGLAPRHDECTGLVPGATVAPRHSAGGRSRLSRWTLPASRAGGAGRVAPPGQSGEDPAGPRGVS